MLEELDTSVIKKQIKARLSKKRYKHSLGVAEVAKRLSEKEEGDPHKAYLTGLLHDYAKPLSNDELIEIIDQSEWEIDNVERKIPEIIHAPAGAELVKREYGIHDREVLEAIRYHTIGCPKMGLLARIIFAADFIEPNRKYPGVDKLRQLVKDNLDLSITALCDSSIKYNLEHNKLIHPNTLLLRNAYLGGNLENEKYIKK